MKDLRSFLVNHGFVERDANVIDEESLVMSYKDILRVVAYDDGEIFLYITKDGMVDKISIKFEYEEDLTYYILGFLEGSSL